MFVLSQVGWLWSKGTNIMACEGAREKGINEMILSFIFDPTQHHHHHFIIFCIFHHYHQIKPCFFSSSSEVRRTTSSDSVYFATNRQVSSVFFFVTTFDETWFDCFVWSLFFSVSKGEIKTATSSRWIRGWWCKKPWFESFSLFILPLSYFSR